MSLNVHDALCTQCGRPMRVLSGNAAICKFCAAKEVWRKLLSQISLAGQKKGS